MGHYEVQLQAVCLGILFGELVVKNWYVAVQGWCRDPNLVLLNYKALLFSCYFRFYFIFFINCVCCRSVHSLKIFKFSWCKQILSTRLACVLPPFKVWTFVTCRHQWRVFTGLLLQKLCLLICKARLSLCKRDAFWVHRRPRKQTFSPPPLPLTDEWQLFKCKLSLTNTTLRDTCFNHGNKGAASGRVGAPSLCDIQMMGRCNKQKQQHQRIDCAGREICCTMCLLPPLLISFIFRVIKARRSESH